MAAFQARHSYYTIAIPHHFISKSVKKSIGLLVAHIDLSVVFNLMDRKPMWYE
jgi:hypothetical protein